MTNKNYQKDNAKEQEKMRVMACYTSCFHFQLPKEIMNREDICIIVEHSLPHADMHIHYDVWATIGALPVRLNILQGGAFANGNDKTEISTAILRDMIHSDEFRKKLQEAVEMVDEWVKDIANDE